MIILDFVLLLFFCFLLIKAADLVMIAIRRLSEKSRSSVYLLSSILLAIGTSFPELFVSLTSALEGSSNLVLGVALGSNIANIALVAAVTALVAGTVKVSRNHLKRDVSVALVAGLLPVILVLDDSLSRVDGLILLAIYLGYATSFFRNRFYQLGEKLHDEGLVYRFLLKERHIDGYTTKEYGRLFAGIALLLFSADMIVKLSISIAASSGIPIFLIGLVVLAVGTSLPEFAFSLRSVKEGEQTMFLGNLLGSVIANSTLIIGIAAIIDPIEVDFGNGYIVASLTFLIVFLLFWQFIRSKFRLDRWEATILITVYICFLIFEFLRL